MADYTYNELMNMQNDAIKRVEDMQKRARQTAGIGEKQQEAIPPQQPKRVPQPNGYLQPPVRQDNPLMQKTNQTGYDFIDNIKQGLGSLDVDPDKALILSLILLLSRESGNEELLTALIYMLT